jgi:hypothetical protein
MKGSPFGKLTLRQAQDEVFYCRKQKIVLMLSLSKHEPFILSLSKDEA